MSPGPVDISAFAALPVVGAEEPFALFGHRLADFVASLAFAAAAAVSKENRELLK